MAASGYTPISLYYSSTTTNVPVNTNLVNGELAINIKDGKLFYKDDGGTVQTLATKTSAGLSNPVTPAQGGTGVANGANNTITFTGNYTFGVTLTNNTAVTFPTSGTLAVLGTAQTFTAAQTFRASDSVRAEAASTQDAVVLAGRAGGTSSYAVSLTPTTLTASRTLTLPDASGTILQSGTAVTVAQGGTGLTSGTSGGIPYFSSTSAITSSGVLSASQFVFGGGAGSAPTSSATVSFAASFTGANTFYNSTGQTFAQASTNDGFILQGRAGGSSSYRITFTTDTLSASRTVTFPDGGGNYTVGYRNIPAVGTKTGSYTLAVADVGKYVQVSTGGSITIPDATFAEGDAITIFNNTSAGITITCTITTAYISGTDTDKATVTLATRGVCTILFISSTVCVISGSVS